MWCLHRHTFHPDWTIGSLYNRHRFICYTLEDAVRIDLGFPKIPGKTAIPAGVYEIIINHSTRFNKPLPKLLGVNFFTGIRIHAGNKPEHTDGCIITGEKAATGFIETSVVALEKVMTELLLPNNGHTIIKVWNGNIPFDVMKQMEKEWSS